MKRRSFRPALSVSCAAMLCLAGAAAGQPEDTGDSPVHYVSTNGAALWPYTNWPTAARVIQEAVNTAMAGDLVLVSNGVYDTGGEAVHGDMTNRVAITKAIAVQGVNGQGATFIIGQPCPTNGGIGSGAIRCAYVAVNAVLRGFTLSNGYTRADGAASEQQSGGGAWLETDGALSNCTLTACAAVYGGGAEGGSLYGCLLSNNTAAGSAGGAHNGVLHGCTLSGNAAEYYGGGAWVCTLYECALADNVTARRGGGANESALYGCTLSGNRADYGGGANESTLDDCTLTDNKANWGGGVNDSTLSNCAISYNCSSQNVGGARASTVNNCVLSHNEAGLRGGGSGFSTLNNCALWGNVAADRGGATWRCTLNNCTVTRNSSGGDAGGAYGGALNNCIVYYNSSPSSSNFFGAACFTNCCTTPDPGSGSGNITAPPLFVDWTNADFRLQAASPCIDTGRNDLVVGTTDLDGRPRILNGIVDMGAYEYKIPVPPEPMSWLPLLLLNPPPAP